VDLTCEFADMITTQRGFQANSRIITTSDEMLQDLLAVKRQSLSYHRAMDEVAEAGPPPSLLVRLGGTVVKEAHP
jgi:hypothetical protein